MSLGILNHPFRMLKKDVITRELYDILEKLRYPEVAQIRFEEFENTILVGKKRLDLLNWVLQESPGFNSTSLNKLKESTLDDKLCKCYSQIGLCNDDNILLGKPTIDKQLPFLNLLILFIRNVHLPQADSTISEEHTSNTFLKEETENVNPNIPSININVKDELENEIQVKSLEPPKVLEDCNPAGTNNFDTLCLDIERSTKESSQQKFDACELILEQFNTSFKKVLSLPTQSHSNEFSKLYTDFCTDLQSIYTTFSIVNKTMDNKAKIKNRPLPENLTRATKPLTQVIKNNLVSIEQACNMFKGT